jgi:hypothetical protein
MRTVILATAFTALMTTSASAATWIAVCNDGQRLQYNQTVGGAGLLYLTATSGGVGTTQMAVMTQTSITASKICGTVNGNSPIPGPIPLSQLCADRAAGIITIKWQSPVPGTTTKEGLFCKATVSIH